MYEVHSISTVASIGVLATALASCSVTGNGFVIALIARLKSLRTVPNIFIGNLALVDLLNAAINLPIHVIYTVLEDNWFRGQKLAIAVTFSNRLFIVLNLASMLALMTDLYFAISRDLKYFVWKTKKKALIGVFLIWFTSIVTVTLFSISLLDINLGNAQVRVYRAEIFKRGKNFASTIVALFIISAAVLGFLTNRSITEKKKKVVGCYIYL